jgi:hypothetical protein
MNTPAIRPRSNRTWRTAPGFALALIAAGVLLAGCTHGSGGNAATTTVGALATGEAGAGVSVTTGPEATTAGTGSAAGGPQGPGPSVVTTAIGGQTTTVTVPQSADPLGVVPAHPTDALDAAVDKVLPGLYGLDSLGATVHGSAIDLAAQGGCAFARDVIRSGQWADTPVLQPHDDVSVYVDVLSRGDRGAMLSLTESTGLCTGRIVTETTQPLALSGTISAAGPAHAVTVLCLAQAQEDGVPPAHVVFVSYRTDGAALLTMVTVPDKVGTHPVDPDDQAGVVVFDPHRSALVQAAATAGMFYDPSSIKPNAGLPGVDVHNAWFQGKGATVTVTSSDPLAGTLDAPHLRREAGGGSAALSAGFSC